LFCLTDHRGHSVSFFNQTWGGTHCDFPVPADHNVVSHGYPPLSWEWMVTRDNGTNTSSIPRTLLLLLPEEPATTTAGQDRPCDRRYAPVPGTIMEACNNQYFPRTTCPKPMAPPAPWMEWPSRYFLSNQWPLWARPVPVKPP